MTANRDKPIKMCQPLSGAVTILAATDLIRGVEFRFFCLLLAISRREILAFFDCFLLLSDRLDASHSHI